MTARRFRRWSVEERCELPRKARSTRNAQATRSLIRRTIVIAALQSRWTAVGVTAIAAAIVSAAGIVDVRAVTVAVPISGCRQHAADTNCADDT